MEGLLFLLAGIAALWILAGPIVMFVLMARTTRLKEDLQKLERDLKQLSLRQLPVGLVTPEATPKPGVPPATRPLPAHIPPPAAPTPMAPIPAPVGATPKEAEDESLWINEPSPVAASVGATSRVTPVPTGMSAAGNGPETSTLEELLAGKWLTWIGAIALMVGVGFFLKYAVDNDMIGPTGRVALGLLGGMGAFMGGAFAMLRGYRRLAEGLVGAALGALYLSLFAAFGWYHLVPQEVAFGGMVLVTAAAMAFSAYFDAQPTAVLGLIGGFLTPGMVSTGQEAQWSLFIYLLILDVGVLATASFRKWQTLQILAFVWTLLWWVGWMGDQYKPEKLVSTVILMTAFFLLFAMLAIWHNVLRRKPSRNGDFFLILATPVAYFAGLYAVTAQPYPIIQGPLAIVLAGVYLTFGLFALKRNPAEKKTVVGLAGVAASFLTLAIPLQLTGHWIAIAWAFEGLLLVELGLRFHEVKLRRAGFGLIAVVQVILFVYSMETLDSPARFSTRFQRIDRVAMEMATDTPAQEPVSETILEPAWTDLFNGRSCSFLASALVLGVLAWEYRRRTRTSMAPETKAAPLVEAWLLGGIPLTLLAMLLTETYAAGYNRRWVAATFEGFYSTWTAIAALALALLAVRSRIKLLDRLSVAVFGLLTLFLAASAFDTLGERADSLDRALWGLPLLNPRGVGFLVAIAAAAIASSLYQRSAAQTEAEAAHPEGLWNLSGVLGAYAYLTGLTMLTVETHALGAVRGWGSVTNLYITVVWTVYAIVTLLAGIYFRARMVRLLALWLFLLTTAKVFLYDVWQLDTVIRYLAFGSLGVALMLVSYLYRRYRDRIRAWITPVLLAALLPVAGMAVPQLVVAQEKPAANSVQDGVTTFSHRWPVAKGAPVTKPADAAKGEDKQTLVRMVLPPDVYGIAQPGLDDLRLIVVDDAGKSREIPYVLAVPRDTDRVVDRAAPLLNLSEVAGRTEFLLDLGETVEPVNEIRIEVNEDDKNYERAVQVYGANKADAAEWNLLTKDGYLLDVTRPGHKLRVDTIEFPQSRFRYYKVSIDNARRPPVSATEKIEDVSTGEVAPREPAADNPQDPGLKRRLGVQLLRQGKTQEGIALLQEALKQNPKDVGLLNDLGYALMTDGKLAPAEKLFREALDIDAKNARAANNLALCVGYAGRFDEAHALFRKWMPDAEADANMGFVHAQMGAIEEAITWYNRALTKDPGLKSAADALVQLASLRDAIQNRKTRVTGAVVSDRAVERAPRHEYPCKIISQDHSAKDKNTQVIVDLGYGRLPTIGVRLDIRYEGNFSRPVSLEAADVLGDKADWRTVTSGEIYRIDRPDLKASQLELTYPETAARYLRLVITDGDNRPLEVTGCAALAVDKLLVVQKADLAAAGPALALYAGVATRPQAAAYDLQRTIGDFNPLDLPAVTLQPAEKNPLFRLPPPPEVPWAEANKPLIWGGTILGVMVMGLLTFALLRAAAKQPPAS